MSIQTIDYPKLKLNGINYVLVPKTDFNRFKKFESKFRIIRKESFPKIYSETDEEGTWETIDFGPKGISAKDLVLLHKTIENDRKI